MRSGAGWNRGVTHLAVFQRTRKPLQRDILQIVILLIGGQNRVRAAVARFTVQTAMSL